MRTARKSVRKRRTRNWWHRFSAAKKTASAASACVFYDFQNRVWRDDVRIILRAAKKAPAYVTLPKIRSVFDAAEMVAFVEASRCEFGIKHAIPCHLLIETHGALAEVFELTALPGVEALSFG